MSGSTARTPGRSSVDADGLLCRYRERTESGVRTAAFWGAVLLPLVHLSVLYDGIAGQQTELFFALLVVNVLCFVVGHDYSP